jgi:hypothetical protein
MTGGSIKDLLESVVRSSHYSSRVRGTEEKVKDCSKFGFSGTTGEVIGRLDEQRGLGTRLVPHVLVAQGNAKLRW